ncbi:MAG: hypothetical protein JSR61_21420 [Proteobacteria bacterium]|nr:hypothetical protein [Pseudomonadota bacterium]
MTRPADCAGATGAAIMRFLTTVALCAFGALLGDVSAQLGPDMKLEDAGFVMRPANTAEQLALIKRVPPRRFVARVKNGKRYYVYADPALCKCVFVGDGVALEAYRDMRKRLQQPGAVPGSGVAPQAELVDDMDGDLAGIIDDDNILDWKF